MSSDTEIEITLPDSLKEVAASYTVMVDVRFDSQTPAYNAPYTTVIRVLCGQSTPSNIIVSSTYTDTKLFEIQSVEALESTN